MVWSLLQQTLINIFRLRVTVVPQSKSGQPNPVDPDRVFSPGGFLQPVIDLSELDTCRFRPADNLQGILDKAQTGLQRFCRRAPPECLGKTPVCPRASYS